MKKALRLARRGEKWASPNPMVGSVIVKDNKIIGAGYHKRFGGNHAEINAINDALGSIEEATVYVTLEPCSHYGKTPPCVDRIIESQPARVVIGVADPNPVVSGRGIRKLEDNGIQVTVGVCEAECRLLNEKFFTFMEKGMPFITLKYAQTLDGRIATKTGHSKWISSDDSRKFVHKLRATHDGILVGIGTVLMDDPELTVRLTKGRNPVRIIVDPRLDVPADAKILHKQHLAKTIMATTHEGNKEKRSLLQKMGIEMITVNEIEPGFIDLKKLFKELGKRNVSSVLVEGGGGIITSLVRENLPDRLFIITAPRIAGRGIEAVGDLGIDNMDDSIRLRFEKVFRKGSDIVFDARIER